MLSSPFDECLFCVIFVALILKVLVYVCRWSSSSLTASLILPKSLKATTYGATPQVIATANHHGEHATNGHYTACILQERQWFTINPGPPFSTCQTCTTDSVLTNNTTVLAIYVAQQFPSTSVPPQQKDASCDTNDAPNSIPMTPQRVSPTPSTDSDATPILRPKPKSSYTPTPRDILADPVTPKLRPELWEPAHLLARQLNEEPTPLKNCIRKYCG